MSALCHLLRAKLPKWKSSGFSSGIAGLDLRSLALFRMGLAITFLSNLWERAKYSFLEDHYFLNGATPPEVGSSGLGFSLLNGVTGVGVYLVGSLFVLLGAMLFVGYRTKLTSWLCFFALLLLAWRNCWAVAGSESALRLILFFACLMPLGHRWSLDAILRARACRLAPTSGERKALTQRPLVVLTFPIGLLIAVLSSMYLMNGIHKLLRPEWRSGEALANAIANVPLTRPLFNWVRHIDSDWIYLLGSWGTVAGEIFLGVAVLLCFYREFYKWATFVGMFLLHLFVMLTLDIGPFSPVLMFSSFMFIPPLFHEWASTRLGRIFDRFRTKKNVTSSQHLFELDYKESPKFLCSSPIRLSGGKRSGEVCAKLGFPQVLGKWEQRFSWMLAPLFVVLLFATNPSISQFLPTKVETAFNQFGTRLYSYVFIQTCWRQFEIPSPHHAGVFVEVVDAEGNSTFYPTGGKVITATQMERSISPSFGRAYGVYALFLAVSSHARDELAEVLQRRGAHSVYFWTYAWDRNLVPTESGTRYPSRRFLLASYGSRRWVSFDKYVHHEEASPQFMGQFFTNQTFWDDATQLTFLGRDGAVYELPNYVGYNSTSPLELNLTTGPDFGIYSVFVNGERFALVDLYSPAVSRISIPLPAYVSAGGLQFTFVCDGQSKLSTGYRLGIDSFSWHEFVPGELSKIKEP